jgi:integrase/recombinase XerD
LYVRKFLIDHHIEWANGIKTPPQKECIPRRVTREDIQKALSQTKDNLRVKAIILLGATSGLRAEELYQLTKEDIDIENRKLYVKHDPVNGKTVKTKKTRVASFNKEAQLTLDEYIKKSGLRVLFYKKSILDTFKELPIQVKDLRKFFSQEWDRRGGPTSIKKILMGHSLKGDVDLMHYNCQSEEDLKKIYDKVRLRMWA